MPTLISSHRFKPGSLDLDAAQIGPWGHRAPRVEITLPHFFSPRRSGPGQKDFPY